MTRPVICHYCESKNTIKADGDGGDAVVYHCNDCGKDFEFNFARPPIASNEIRIIVRGGVAQGFEHGKDIEVSDDGVRVTILDYDSNPPEYGVLAGEEGQP
jgi:DNA-directed RNA polymerase subunit RPC12/RpoP